MTSHFCLKILVKSIDWSFIAILNTFLKQWGEIVAKIGSMKERFKKMMSVLDQAEFKEKVVLAAEVEKLKKVIFW